MLAAAVPEGLGLLGRVALGQTHLHLLVLPGHATAGRERVAVDNGDDWAQKKALKCSCEHALALR